MSCCVEYHYTEFVRYAVIDITIATGVFEEVILSILRICSWRKSVVLQHTAHCVNKLTESSYCNRAPWTTVSPVKYPIC